MGFIAHSGNSFIPRNIKTEGYRNVGNNERKNTGVQYVRSPDVHLSLENKIFVKKNNIIVKVKRYKTKIDKKN